MAESDDRRKRHFILENAAETKPFRSPQSGGRKSKVPDQDRDEHGAELLGQIKALYPQAAATQAIQKESGLSEGIGVQIEFESFPEIELAFEMLAQESQDIELLNVRHEKELTTATVFVPEGKLDKLEKLVHDYLDVSKDSASGPKRWKLLNAIAQIRTATLKTLWTDAPEELSASYEEEFWWEVWLAVRGDRDAVTSRFKQSALALGFRVADSEIRFPERTVLLVYGTRGLMEESLPILNGIAELRRAKETAEFFDELLPEEQSDWLDDLRQRTTVPEETADVPYVCILDTGVNNGHPLIAAVLSDADMHTIEPDWGTEDIDEHGTPMAGLAMAGDLTDALESGNSMQIGHRLESVKLLPKSGENKGGSRLHGELTSEAVSRPEVTAPQRHRIFSMAITARDDRDHGRPSTWSAAIDKLASDADGDGADPRLFVVSAGNIRDLNAWAEYPESNKTHGICDPGQSWNALIVGAATHLARMTESDAKNYRPVAPTGGLSPFSTTSFKWDDQWPLKPDVVFEGGNAAINEIGAVSMQSLSLLTASSTPRKQLFATANATSAASALAARMAAQLMAEYPNLWPETIRALIVHSAEWTDAMRQMFLSNPRQPAKKDMAELIRCCGFGMPNLERAMWSLKNSLTMIREDRLRPFKREGGAQPTFGEMDLHDLPWPSQELEALEGQEVEMRATLSYFVEPNPSARGIPQSRYRYESHGLRYDLKRPAESETQFLKRINVEARGEEPWARPTGSDSKWMLGKQNRHKGSIHSDIWRGTAADLADRGVMAVYPSSGWWKTRHKQECYNRDARYSLVVSIHAPKADVDLYAAVKKRAADAMTVKV